MRLIRSFFFGSLAMLAAAIFMYSPASAADRNGGIYSVSVDVPDFAVFDVAVMSVIPERTDSPKRLDAHDAIYIRANQPLSAWRTATDAYSRIDPHIQIG